jgi:hypothetical protein
VRRLAVTASFALAFISGALVTFSVACGIGLAAKAVVPTSSLFVASIMILIGLAGLDVFSLRRGSYCKVGFIRQTPQNIQYHQSIITTAIAWGFDTGLAVTTVRVTASTWAALALCSLGLASPLAGIASGVSFALPVALLQWNPRIGAAATADTAGDPGLVRQLRLRPAAQRISTVTLTTCASLIYWFSVLHA